MPEGRKKKRTAGNRFARIVENMRNMSDADRLRVMTKANLLTRRPDETIRSEGGEQAANDSGNGAMSE